MRRALLGSAALLMVVVVDVAPASADCATPAPLPERLRDASVVFVGRVTNTNDEGRAAIVRVEQVWKGAPVSDRVTVKGGPEGNLRTSVDRSFETGARYLFVPERDGGHFRDSACTATREYSADVAQFAPDTVNLPRRSSTGSSGLATQAAIALAAVLTGVIVRVAFIRLRRRRAPVSPS